ncbi:MAG: WYL domain-containing protein [Polyangiaceae bacterium]|nr:WYL domain-containing protein [Polyangiaceae bacterium]
MIPPSRPSVMPSSILRPRTPRGSKTPTVGRPSGSFTQHKRIDKLREILENEPRGITLDDLATTLRITKRSVRRYLRELHEVTELESVITKPASPHLWRIKPSERGRAVLLRRAQAYAILAARSSLDVLKGSALFDEVDIAFDHIEQIAKTPFRASGKTEISGEQSLQDRFFLIPPTSRSYAARGEDLDELFRAVADLRVLRYRPRMRPTDLANPASSQGERLVFLPYAFVVYKGTVALLGAHRPRGGVPSRSGGDDVEVLAMDAMTEIRASETEHFELPKGFDASDYVHGEFGVGPRAEAERVVIEFDARVADEIKAKKWSRHQQIARAADGRVRLSLPLANIEAIVAWTLSYGDAAHVVEPAEVAHRIANILERARTKYKIGMPNKSAESMRKS